MANCITCGKPLHPERAQKYDYCTDPDCQERNARGLEMVAVGVNKAADQFMVLDQRTKGQMAAGRFKKLPEVQPSIRVPAHPRPARRPKASAPGAERRSRVAPRPPWSQTQERLALIYRAMGMKPDAIARRLGVSERLATRILLAATAQGKR
jgi:hypothetical protein